MEKLLKLSHIAVIVAAVKAWVKGLVDEAVKKATDKVDAILADAPEAFDTFKEVAEYIEDHASVKEALEEAIGNKLGKDELVYATDAEVTAAVTAALEEE